MRKIYILLWSGFLTGLFSLLKKAFEPSTLAFGMVVRFGIAYLVYISQSRYNKNGMCVLREGAGGFCGHKLYVFRVFEKICMFFRRMVCFCPPLEKSLRTPMSSSKNCPQSYNFCPRNEAEIVKFLVFKRNAFYHDLNFLPTSFSHTLKMIIVLFVYLPFLL